MFERLYKDIHQHVTLSDEEWIQCKSMFTSKRMRKKQFLLQEGNICSNIAFIEKGGLYSYSTDEDWNQHVMQISFEGWWIGDLQSFFTNKPSTLTIEVLENCELLLINQSNHRQLLETIPAYNHYIRMIVQEVFIALQRRMENAFGFTAEEKYARLLEYNPDFLNRAPQRLVASFLGITPETLSRVRGQIAQ